MFEVYTEGFDDLVDNLVAMATDYRKIVVRQFGNLGEMVRYMCRVELADVRYTGALEQSFVVEVRPAMEVRIYPTAAHRMYVRMGTRPHWAPIGPLKRWAAVKLGDEQAGYKVQHGIAKHGTSMWQQRKRGTKANPWPERVLARADFQRALDKTAKNIGAEIVTEIVR
jgi:hypothetical protein